MNTATTMTTAAREALAYTCSATRYRYIGITDECLTCQKCGRDELKSTVVLAILDADGTEEEITWYGSTCAAKVLGVKGGGRAVRGYAEAATHRTLTEAAHDRSMLDHYGLPLTGDPSDAELETATDRYIDVHANAMWASGQTRDDWRQMVLDMVERRQATITDAGYLARPATTVQDRNLLARAEKATTELRALGLAPTGHVSETAMILAVARFEREFPAMARACLGPADLRPMVRDRITAARGRIYAAAHLTPAGE